MREQEADRGNKEIFEKKANKGIAIILQAIF